MVKIELTEEDAELYKEFCQFYEQFKILRDNGLFDNYIGQKTVHKNGKQIRRVDTLTIDLVTATIN